jgi:hypothetical protein
LSVMEFVRLSGAVLHVIEPDETRPRGGHRL